ncbi:hypothetical protein EG329_002148 [Mollisiaceae sp. DMI_Dod_QoI]|nr:hypothetical protein EG329_002148 [Helotiales sp. DMI_Dod_QoI]
MSSASIMPVYHYRVFESKLQAKVLAVGHYNRMKNAHAKALFKNVPRNSSVVITDKTIFYPGDSQPCDTGVMHLKSDSLADDPEILFLVSQVRKDASGIIFHLGKFAPNSPAFSPGQEACQHINAAKRHLHSRIHTGGHIVRLAVGRLQACGDIASVTNFCSSRSYPDTAYVKFRGLIEGHHREVIEREANRIVEMDVPVRMQRWTPQEAEDKRFIVPGEGDIPAGKAIRAIEFDGLGADSCCGTFVATTADVGHITIKRIWSGEAVTKILYSVDCSNED